MVKFFRRKCPKEGKWQWLSSSQVLSFVFIALQILFYAGFHHQFLHGNPQEEPIKNQALKPSEKRDLEDKSKTIPLISVCLPVYEGSGFMRQVMGTLGNQTYPNLEILISIEPSEDATESEEILKRFQSENPQMNIQIHRQPHRLQLSENLNYLLSRVKGKYWSFMACDDTLPSNYFEALAHCLDSNPEAVNCFPYVAGTEFDGDTHSRILRCGSYAGPVHERVEQVIIQRTWIPFRGVVRRPVFGSMERYFLPRHRMHPDLVVMVQHAVDGTLLEVDVPYYKHFRNKGTHKVLYDNATIFSLDQCKRSFIDEYARKYNMAHSFVKSSQNFAKNLGEQLARDLDRTMKMYRRTEPSVRKKVVGEAVVQFWQRIRKPKRVAILGAGFQGSLMALMFCKHGYDVTLIDKSNDIMNRASAAGEGRIHLGLEYSNDPLMDTGEYMVKSSLRFSAYVEHLIGREIDWTQLKSERLKCLLPHDSLVTPGQFEEYARKLEAIYERILSEEPDLSYLGERPPRVLLGRTDVPDSVDSSYINAAYDSIEVCIVAKKLKVVLREALYEQGVDMVFGRTVLDVKRNKVGDDELGRLRVVSDIAENDYDAVVNCLWEGRANIDRKMGLNVTQDESYGFRSSVRLPNLQIHAHIPSVSIMNGPFGDFVRYGPEDQVYFAWHPVSVYGITQNETEAQQYENHANFNFPENFEKEKVEGFRKAFEKVFPRADSSFFDNADLGAGYIVGNGVTDIDDPKSGFHRRCDYPHQIADGYISVKTQKLTTAPYNTYLLEKTLFKDTLVTQA